MVKTIYDSLKRDVNRIYDTIIIGSGPAGLTAAIYSSRSSLKTLVIGGVVAGGQLMLTREVEDYPGFPEAILGPELVSRMRKQVERFGAEVINGDVIKTDFSKRPFKVSTSKSQYLARSVIIATGASAKWLGLPSEKRLIGKGVSACAVCDGPFFKNKKVAIVGGGDSAMKEALFLSKIAREVLIIHMLEKLNAFKANQEKAASLPNVQITFNTVVEEVLGKEKVEGVRVKNTKTGEIKEINLDALFVAIGYNPSTKFLVGQVDLDKRGFIVVRDETRTSVPGVFAAGDVSDPVYQQAITAAAAGCRSAMGAESFLENEK